MIYKQIDPRPCHVVALHFVSACASLEGMDTFVTSQSSSATSSSMDDPQAASDWPQLDWPVLSQTLARQCQTPYGASMLSKEALWLESVEDVAFHQVLINDLRTMLQREGDIDLPILPEVRPLFQRLAKAGVLYSVEELAQCHMVLFELTRLFRFVIRYRSEVSSQPIRQFLAPYPLPLGVLEKLEALSEPKAGAPLRPTASARYAQLSDEMTFVKADIERQLAQLLPKISHALQEVLYTQRDDRYVVPVKVDMQSQVKGLYVDTSASGETIYIEPASIAKRSLQYQQLQKTRAREVEAILRQVSEHMQPEVDVILNFIEGAARLDVALAKARLALAMDAEPVALATHPNAIYLKKARHPLLALMQPKTVVANDLVYPENCQCLIISGPNTGGKTVTLKMLGLLAVMLRCGMLLPVAEGSSLYPFEAVLADCGDQQSVVQNLSTFSAHLLRLKLVLETETLSNALVLIDEIGAGTDPAEAAALSESVLRTLVEKHRATVMVTTHLSQLKRLAYEAEGFENACVEFNTQTLQPTYRLLLQSAGDSHAIEIARTLGLPEAVLTVAETLYQSRQSTTDELIASIETRQAQASIRLKEADALRDRLKKDQALLQEKLNRLDGEKRQILETYKSQLSEQFRQVRHTIDDAKTALKRRKQSPSDLRYASKKLNSASSDLHGVADEQLAELYQDVQIDWAMIECGDRVLSKTLNIKADVLEKHDKSKELTVRSGLIKTRLPLSDIIQVDAQTGHVKASLSGAPIGGSKRVSKTSSQVSASQALRVPLRECHLLGMRVEDALGVMEKFLDDALMDNLPCVAVIHGQGTGALKSAVRDLLSELPFVARYYPAEAVDGGDGKTIIELK